MPCGQVDTRDADQGTPLTHMPGRGRRRLAGPHLARRGNTGAVHVTVAEIVSAEQLGHALQIAGGKVAGDLASRRRDPRELLVSQRDREHRQGRSSSRKTDSAEKNFTKNSLRGLEIIYRRAPERQSRRFRLDGALREDEQNARPVLSNGPPQRRPNR